MTVTTNTDFHQIVKDLFTGKEHLLENITSEDFTHLLKLAEDRENSKYFLKHRKVITLTSCVDTENLWEAKHLFPGFHDSDLKNWNLDEAQMVGQTMNIKIDEMQPGKDGTFTQIFNGDDETIWIPQNRIKQIVLEHRDELLQDGNANLFPIKRKDGTRFVVRVRVVIGELSVNVNLFERGNVWHGDYLHRVFTAVALKS